MWYIFDKSGRALATSDKKPNIEDLKSRGETAIESKEVFKLDQIVASNGKIIAKPNRLSAMEVANRQRQADIKRLEALLAELYGAHNKLLATNAEQADIDQCKAEIKTVLAELEVLYNGTTA